ncbi:unnamed protein product [Didymodactylos carnosus]|uniref:DUF4371 domain-containing protein n=1 Tax=Didymodactylos carnosus TaxID=1234261 RepID=A0A814BGZ5_9BILA|nr:unnamed protein product [Didymodactylos carnosus]CAF3705035.1 unnamed protein product [Didymodactylos carnosus]
MSAVAIGCPHAPLRSSSSFLENLSTVELDRMADEFENVDACTVHRDDDDTDHKRRTAGFLAIVSNCNVIMGWNESVRSEGMRRTTYQLLKLLRLGGILPPAAAYDSACTFVAYLRNQYGVSLMSSPYIDELLQKKYCVDRFHRRNHTRPECKTILSCPHPINQPFFDNQNTQASSSFQVHRQKQPEYEQEDDDIEPMAEGKETPLSKPQRGSLEFLFDKLSKKQKVGETSSSSTDSSQTSATVTDPLAKSVLEDSAASATYLSPTVQNELIHHLGTQVRERIADKVRDRLFCLMADETRDISGQEQLSIVLRVVNNQSTSSTQLKKEDLIKEHFLGLTKLDASDKAYCTQVGILPPSGEDRWALAGLDLNVDWVLKCGNIVAYKLQWFSGGWSDWYVPGVNDMDDKVNDENVLRRMWSYFDDHNHTFIICKNTHYQLANYEGH